MFYYLILCILIIITATMAITIVPDSIVSILVEQNQP